MSGIPDTGSTVDVYSSESCKSIFCGQYNKEKQLYLRFLNLFEEFNLSNGPHLPGPDQIFKPPGYFSRQGPLQQNSSNGVYYREIQ